jgi:hypothetical protein
MDRVKAFLDAALAPPPADERSRLDTRVRSFVGGLKGSGALYEHIGKYLSTACTAENAEFAISEIQRKAPRKTVEDIIQVFNYSPVEGMNYAVAWTIENFLRSKAENISLSVEGTAPNGEAFTVTFKAGDETVSSSWVKEYGIWRIERFGDFAAGDKELITRKEKERKDESRLKTDTTLHLSAGYAHILDRGPAFGADLTIRFDYFAFGFAGYIRGSDFTQIEALLGVHVPIRVRNKIAFIPYGMLGPGLVFQKGKDDSSGVWDDDMDIPFNLGIAIQGGLMVTTSAVPGLYLKAGYQYSWYFKFLTDKGAGNPHIIFAGVGYAF